MTRTWKLSMYICEAFNTLFCELQQTIVFKVASNNSYKAFFDTIYSKRFPCLASVYIDTKDLIARSHCVYRDFLKGKMFRCYIKVPFPLSLFSRKNGYIVPEQYLFYIQ